MPLFWTIIIIIGVAFLAPYPVFAEKTRNILLLHSYHQGLQWTDSISTGIQSELKSLGKGIELHYEYLDTKRNPGEEYFNRIVEFERQKTKLTEIPFEAIICSDNNALRFVVDNKNELYPNVPVVFCGVNNFSLDMLKTHKDITGVVESIDYAATLDLIIKFHPKRKNILVILDRTITGKSIKKEFSKIATRYKSRLEFEYFQDFLLPEVPVKISGLGSGDAIYLLTFNRDREDNFISYVDGIRMIQSESKVPIYGSWDFYYGNGIVGGMITSGFSNGQEAAKLVKKILKGKQPGNLPISSKTPNHFMFDFEQMERFDITKADLPPESTIINLPVPFLKKYEQFIIFIAGIIILIFPIIALRMYTLKRKREALENLNKELDQRLGTALSKIKVLSGFLPICSHCKKIRDEKGAWSQLESYIGENSEAKFSHSMCPDCSDDFYGGQDWYVEMKKKDEN